MKFAQEQRWISLENDMPLTSKTDLSAPPCAHFLGADWCGMGHIKGLGSEHSCWRWIMRFGIQVESMDSPKWKSSSRHHKKVLENPIETSSFSWWSVLIIDNRSQSYYTSDICIKYLVNPVFSGQVRSFSYFSWEFGKCFSNRYWKENIEGVGKILEIEKKEKGKTKHHLCSLCLCRCKHVGHICQRERVISR